MATVSPELKTQSIYRARNMSFKCVGFIYKIVHILFGIDFGFVSFESSKLNILLKVFLAIQSFVLCIVLAYDLYSRNFVLFCWCFLNLSRYLVFVVILMFSKAESTFFNLIHDLRAIDLGLKKSSSSYHSNSKLLFFILLCVLLKSGISLSYCTIYRNSIHAYWSTILYLLVLISCDIVLITYAFMFFAVNNRLKQLVSLVKDETRDFVSKQYLYKSIVDIAEQHKTAFDPVMVTALVFDVPQVMITIYSCVKSILAVQSVERLWMLGLEVCTVVQMFALLFMPACFAGMLSTQADRIIIELHDILLQPQGEAYYDDIERFIRYVEARPCRLRVCKVIPLNADLLGLLLSFCVTYLIVIIQFTHIF